VQQGGGFGVPDDRAVRGNYPTLPADPVTKAQDVVVVPSRRDDDLETLLS
jgi:hypothetical protein